MFRNTASRLWDRGTWVRRNIVLRVSGLPFDRLILWIGRWVSGLPIRWTALLLGWLVIIACLAAMARGFLRGPLADFAAVHAAGLASLQGLNPYDERLLLQLNPAALFPFIYPPYVLPVARWIAHIPYFAAGTMMGVIVLLAVTYMYLAQARLFGLVATSTGALVLFIGTAAGSAVWAASTGNVSVLLYALLTFGLVRLENKRPLAMVLVVAAAALVKPYYLGFLLLPLLIDWRRCWPWAVLAVVAVALAYAGSYVSDPVMFQHFRGSLAQRYAQGDYGDGPFGFFLTAIDRLSVYGKIHLPHAVGYAAFAGFLGVAFVLFLRLAAAYRKEASPEQRTYLLGLLWIGMILCLPRLKVYDGFAAFVPAFALLARRVWDRPLVMKPKWFLLPFLMLPVGFSFFAHIAELISLHWLTVMLGLCWLLAYWAYERGVRETNTAAVRL